MTRVTRQGERFGEGPLRAAGLHRLGAVRPDPHDLEAQERTAVGVYVDEHQHVGACVTELGLFVGWLDVSWPSPASPRLWFRGIEHLVDLDPRDVEGTPGALASTLERAARRREDHLVACRHCGVRTVPGHTASGSCHGCLTRHEGAVF